MIVIETIMPIIIFFIKLALDYFKANYYFILVDYIVSIRIINRFITKII